MGVDVPSKQQKKSKSQIESKTTKGSKEYIPTPRSGPYALLVALHESRKPTLTKVELQQAAQPHCDSSFTQTNAQCRYSAWSSISLLLAKELVEKSGRPSKFRFIILLTLKKQKLFSLKKKTKKKKKFI